jgi:hypothetical protein
MLFSVLLLCGFHSLGQNLWGKEKSDDLTKREKIVKISFKVSDFEALIGLF